MKRIVIIGATSAIAEHCARLWVKEPVNLVLLGRQQHKLDGLAQDLSVRSPQSLIATRVAEFSDAEVIASQIAEICVEPVDVALIAHGSLPDQLDCQNDLALCRETLEINGVSPVLFAEAFARHMAQKNAGTLIVMGSVAGDRGRKSNYVYGAAKGMVTRYVQGLQHRFSQTGVRIILIKPGPTDTPMTAHFKAAGAKLASVEAVAQQIVTGIQQGKSTIYAPKKWALIMMVVRHMPSLIFNRINI